MLVPSFNTNASMPEHVTGKTYGPMWHRICLINCKFQVPFYVSWKCRKLAKHVPLKFYVHPTKFLLFCHVVNVAVIDVFMDL